MCIYMCIYSHAFQCVDRLCRVQMTSRAESELDCASGRQYSPGVAVTSPKSDFPRQRP